MEDVADDLRTDPQEYFDSLSPDDQDKYFTKAGAEWIRLGADIGQVVNARRGARGLSQPGRLTAAEQRALRGGKRGRLERVDVYGRQVAVTTEGTTVRGVAGKLLVETGGTTRDPGARHRRARTPRLMPEALIELADGDRDEAVRLLRRFGYLTVDSEQRRTSSAPRPPVPPAELDDAALDAAMQAAIGGEDWDRFGALSAEADERDQRARDEAVVTARRVRDRARRETRRATEEQHRAERYETLIEGGTPEEEAVETAYGVTVAQQRRDAAVASLRDQGYREAGFEDLARASYRDKLQSDYWAAEEATNGYLLNRQGEDAGIDPRDLWLRNEAYARRWASEELLAWWDVHGRVTFEEWKAQLLGDTAWVGRLRSARGDFLT